MGSMNRIYRVEDAERRRAADEVKRIINTIPDARLMALFPYGDVKSVPPPEDLGIGWPLLWRATGRPAVMNPEDGSIAPGISDKEHDAINLRMARVLRPLLNRLEVIDKRRTR